MKAGDAAFFCAVRTLAGSGLRPAGDVLLTYVVGELQGGIGTELVGLVPREAIDGSAGGRPLLDVIRPGRTIEARLDRRPPSPPGRRAGP